MPNPASLIPTTYKATDLQEADWSIFLEVLAGLSAIAQMRGVDPRIPAADGAMALNRVPDSMPILLEGQIKGTSGTHYRSLLQLLQRLFRPRGGPGSLSVVLEDGTVLTANARAVSLLVGPRTGMRSRVSVEMEAVDPPYWLGVDVVDEARPIAASPTNFTLEHPGTEETNRIVLDFTGPITNPRVTNMDTGLYVEALVDVPAGEHLIIDCLQYTALLNGVTAIGSVVHSGDRRWLVLEPGTNNMRVTATATGGTLTTTFEPPYL